MRPFDLPPWDFLLLYFGFAIVVVLALHLLRLAAERRSSSGLSLRDPYLVACLRDGPREVLRLATLSLGERGLLNASGHTAETKKDASRAGTPRVEQAVLGYFGTPRSLWDVYTDPGLIALAREDYEPRLREAGLLPDRRCQARRGILLVVALVTLLSVAGIRTLIDLQTGRIGSRLRGDWLDGVTDVLPLLGLATLAAIWAIIIYNPYRTRAGDTQLAGARAMFSGLRRRAASIRLGSGTREFMWLAAAFGGAGLPATTSAFAQHLFPNLTHNLIQAGAEVGVDVSVSAGCGGSCGGGCGGCGG